jgi:hypothetical protein
MHHSGMHVTSTDVLYSDHVSDFTFHHLERVGVYIKIFGGSFRLREKREAVAGGIGQW